MSSDCLFKKKKKLLEIIKPCLASGFMNYSPYLAKRRLFINQIHLMSLPLLEKMASKLCSAFRIIKVLCSVQSLSHIELFATPWTAALQASLSITNSWSLLKLKSIESVMPSSHLILYRPLPPNPASIRVFSNESTLCMRWPKYWSFSFSISPSNEYSGLISFRMDWLDLLAV